MNNYIINNYSLMSCFFRLKLILSSLIDNLTQNISDCDNEFINTYETLHNDDKNKQIFYFAEYFKINMNKWYNTAQRSLSALAYQNNFFFFILF